MVFAVICIKAIEPAMIKFPNIKYDIKNVLKLPVNLQLIVLARLRIVVSLKAHVLSYLEYATQ